LSISSLMTQDHSTFMKQAFILAQKGLGHVSPNPLVGCVIVKDDKIIAEGYHQKFGGAHAEVNAILNLPSPIDPKDCTLYVNLEPCCHHGKTPPCTDLIIARGFKKVVVSNSDPNPLVAGIGIEKLKQAGIEVITGVCEKEGRYLNRRFFTFHEKKRPYIILKWAQTADGFISKWPLPDAKNENRISGEEAQTFVHQMRAAEDAILVGKNTVLNDDPFLTTRLVEGKNPLRVIITGNDIPKTFNVFNSDAKIVVFNPHKSEVKDHINYIRLHAGNAIPQILSSLYKMGVSSVLIEGGLYTLTCFISAGMWDEQHVFVNPALHFENGIQAPKTTLSSDFQLVGKDRYYLILNPESSK
jgi:diaminohydroxyphosphoribosylaminopyrimidine deaminase/5-amino-6-(5-phosphoribosylamino)uracil reductase